MIDLQTWVECLQQNNTTLIPFCSTFYNCGLTVIDSSPRGNIHRLSVIDKINPTTFKEDATAADDYCSEIAYNEVDFCHVHSYLDYSRRRGCCGSIPLFFGLAGCSKARFPVPTDEGLPAGLPKLPLGNHYPQTSTDRKYGRAEMGIWAKQRGAIYIAPWIQSTETVILVWDGIKRIWSDADLIDDDPLLSKAVSEYLQWKQQSDFDRDFEPAMDSKSEYMETRAMLMHQCNEETRIRQCEPSRARSATLTSLFYNDEQSATATCPDGTTGSATSTTIPAGTVASAISKADANQKAKSQAQTQAEQMLNCTGVTEEFTNDAQSATAACQGEEGAPPPEGSPVTKTVPAGAVSSTVSKTDANQQALALAQQQAAAALQCNFWNRAQTANVTCPNTTHKIVTIAAHAYSSNVSQADADQQALSAATNQATTQCGAGTFFNIGFQTGTKSGKCNVRGGQLGCMVTVNVTVFPNSFSSTVSQADANQQAQSYANSYANQQWIILCFKGECGTFLFDWPPQP